MHEASPGVQTGSLGGSLNGMSGNLSGVSGPKPATPPGGVPART